MNSKAIQGIARAISLTILLTVLQPLNVQAASCQDIIGHVQISEISSTVFQQLQQVTRKIYEKYPPSEYFYVGVGRSPTAIIALMQASGVPAVTLPLSQFKTQPLAKGFANETGFGKYANFANALTPEVVARLNEHFKQFLPTEETLAGKKILLIDYSHTGKTLIGARAYIELAFQSWGQSTVVEIVSLKNPQEKPDPVMIKNEVPVITPQKDLIDVFYDSGFDKFSEFERFHPKVMPNVPQRNPLYKILLYDFQRRLRFSSIP